MNHGCKPHRSRSGYKGAAVNIADRILLTAAWTEHRLLVDLRPPCRSEHAAPDERLRQMMKQPGWFNGGLASTGWNDLRHSIDDLLQKRTRCCLDLLPATSLRPTPNGRLLGCWPAISDWVGLAIEESNGFFDQGDVPGWDSWIAAGDLDLCREAVDGVGGSFVLDDPLHRESCGPCILAWIPSMLIPTVQDAIQLMPTRTCAFVSA